MIDTTRRTDEDLLLAYARDGEREALEKLVARHFGPAYRLALRALRDPGAAEDAAEEALVGLIRGAPRFTEGRPFAPWFTTLVLNAVRKAERSRRRREHHERRAGEARPRRSVTPAALEREDVEAHLALLPADVKVPLILHYYEGRSHEEVARLVGCPKGTAASRIRRGLEQLKESLAGAGFGGGAVASVVAILEQPGAKPALPGRPDVARLEKLAAKATTLALLAKAGVLALVLAAATTAVVAGGASSKPPAAAPLAAAAPADPAPMGSVSATAKDAAPGTPLAVEPVGGRPEDDAKPAPADSKTATKPAAPATANAALVVLVRDVAGRPVPGARVKVDDAQGSGLRGRMEGLLEHLSDLRDDAASADAKGRVKLALDEDRDAKTPIFVYAGSGTERGMAGPFTLDGSTVEVTIRALEKPEPGCATLLVALTRRGAPLEAKKVDVGWRFEIDALRVNGELEHDFPVHGGLIAIRDVPPGEHTFQIRAKDAKPAVLKVTLERDQVQRATVAIEPGTALVGHVLAPAGASIASATVTATPLGDEAARAGSSAREPAAADGGYRLAGLAPGEYRVTASLEGYASRSVAVHVGSEETCLGPDLRLGDGAALSGRVVRADGRPVEDASVEVEHGGARDEVTTGERGRFVLRGLAAGEHKLVVQGPADSELVPVDRSVTVGGSDLDVGDIVLAAPRKLAVHGRVVDATGSAVEGATVTLVARAAVQFGGHELPEEITKTTDAQGRFVVDGLEQYVSLRKVTLGARAGGRLSEWTEARPGQEEEVLLRLDRIASRITGKLEGAAALGVRTVTVENVERTVTLAADGSFSIADLVGAEASLVFKGPTFNATEVVRLKPGEETRVDLSVARIGTIEASVEGAERARFAASWTKRDSVPEGAVGSSARLSKTAFDAVAGPVLVQATISAERVLLLLRRRIELRAGAVEKVAFRLPAREELGVVEGTAPEGSASVLLEAGEGFVAIVTLDPEKKGAFRVEVPAGAYSVSTEPESKGPAPRVDVGRGTTTRVVFAK